MSRGDRPRLPSRGAPPPMVPVPRLLLFDLDDTLCDYATARALRLRIAFGLDGVERDFDRMIADSLAVQPHGADHFPDLFRRHGGVDPVAAARAMRWYRENRFHGLELFADAAAALSRLRRVRLETDALLERRIGIVTNGPAEVQRAKLKLLGVLDLVDFVVISGELGAWKPEPAIFAEALRLGGAIAAEGVFVGDSPEHDIAGARAAGLRAVWMNRTGAAWPAAAVRPDAEVRGLAEVVALLGGVATPDLPEPP